MVAGDEPAPLIVVVMGVSGSGKTTVGRMIAGRLALPFVDGDSFHSTANRTTMAAGHALDDEDRQPWLTALAEWLGYTSRAGHGAVLACSALKHDYRDVLRRASPHLCFVHLAVDRDTAVARVSRRTGHFMPTALIDSQYDALEPLRPDEPGATVDADDAEPQVLEQALRAIARCSTQDTVRTDHRGGVDAGCR